MAVIRGMIDFWNPWVLMIYIRLVCRLLHVMLISCSNASMKMNLSNIWLIIWMIRSYGLRSGCKQTGARGLPWSIGSVIWNDNSPLYFGVLLNAFMERYHYSINFIVLSTSSPNGMTDHVHLWSFSSPHAIYMRWLLRLRRVLSLYSGKVGFPLRRFPKMH